MSANVNRIAFTQGMPWWVGMPQHDRGQWQQLRQEGYATAAEMMAATGMDFPVSKAKIYIHPDGKEPIEVQGKYAIVRGDTQQPLAEVAVGNVYEPISFPEMFSTVDQIVEMSNGSMKVGGAHYETAGTLYDGRTGWALVKLDRDIFIADDAIRTYLLATTSHDGTSSLKLKLVNTRVVCCNTFAMSLSEHSRECSFAFRHTKNFQVKVEEAQKVLFQISEQRAEWEAFAKSLLAKPITQDTYRKLIEVLCPVPSDTPDRPLTNRMIENVNKRRLTIAKAAEAEDLDAVRWTAWGALNAVADAEQHLLVRDRTDETAKVAGLFERSFNQDDMVRLAADFLTEVTV